MFTAIDGVVRRIKLTKVEQEIVLIIQNFLQFDKNYGKEGEEIMRLCLPKK